MDLKRSNVEAAKRIFLDRLSTGAQPVSNKASPDLGPGDGYVYGAEYDAFNLGVGADCSGSSGIFIGAALYGFAGMSWGRQFTTETFPAGFPGFTQTTQADLLAGNYPIKVCIGHHGGGAESHMHISIDGVTMESNGSSGTCTAGHGAMTDTDPYWNDWWVFDGTIIEDTTWRQTLSYPQGLDYAGGRPNAADIKAAGYSFVCRYLTDGGATLPGKQLLPDEFTSLLGAGLSVVFNWETTEDFMLGGAAQGTADATAALNYVRSLPGMASANPVVFFSCDFDEAEDQQDAINAYLQAASVVLGGVQFVGIYGAYYVCQRALDAGVAKYMWQTEAWSGGNVESRVNIYQRNDEGYATVDGVECDVNEAHTDDFGQWPPLGSSAPPATGGDTTTGGALTQEEHDALMQLWGALFNLVPSQSKYGDGAQFAVKDLISFIDGRAHEAMVEREALLGAPQYIALVKTAADAGDVAAQYVLSKCPTNAVPAK